MNELLIFVVFKKVDFVPENLLFNSLDFVIFDINCYRSRITVQFAIPRVSSQMMHGKGMDLGDKSISYKPDKSIIWNRVQTNDGARDCFAFGLTRKQVPWFISYTKPR